jgi:nucleotide-binding universal stress UspA family protein
MVQRAWDLTRRELLLSDCPRVLVPLDGSAFAEAALPIAAGLADDVGGQVVLVRVEVTPRDVESVQDEVAAHPAGRGGGRIRQYLASVAARVAAEWPDLQVSTVARVGEAAASIARAAMDSQAALVVMATHGRTGLPRAAFGSVAGRVLHHGSTPLVLVPPTLVSATPVFRRWPQSAADTAAGRVR